jgi:hypothetical protein
VTFLWTLMAWCAVGTAVGAATAILLARWQGRRDQEREELMEETLGPTCEAQIPSV